MCLLITMSYPTANNYITNAFPAGVIVPYAGATAPQGYLLCDGSAISRSAYANLFGVIGVTYGAGDSSTTFNLPDMKGRVPVGKSTDTEFDALGETGGAKTHTLQATEIPAHTHTAPSYIDITPAGGIDKFIVYGNPEGHASYNFNINANTGGGGSHNNLQPYITLNYIIKT